MKKINIHPKGSRVIVEQDKIEETTPGGIIIKRDNELAEQASVIRGTIVALGDEAWDQWPSPWAKVGDRVYFAKYAGKNIPDPVTNEMYLVMDDRDIVATIDEEEEKKDD